jgi:CheY-like chemotaxis protein
MKKRILIAEDEPMIRELMSDVLDRAGYDVDTVNSIATARAAAGPFDLLVLDRKLGDGDGETIARLFPDTPTLTVSGVVEADLIKPFTGRDLQVAVARKLGEAAPDEAERRTFTRRHGDKELS